MILFFWFVLYSNEHFTVFIQLVLIINLKFIFLPKTLKAYVVTLTLSGTLAHHLYQHHHHHHSFNHHMLYPYTLLKCQKRKKEKNINTMNTPSELENVIF